MPRYDFFCICGNKEEHIRSIEDRNVNIKCSSCGLDMKRQEVYSIAKDWFRPHWNENLDVEPVYVDSKKQYKEECKKRGLTARCLL